MLKEQLCGIAKNLERTALQAQRIGSLGWDLQEPGVQNLTVKSVAFRNSDDGVRIKTWARSSNAFVKNVLFKNIFMSNVKNPILIDQDYCPNSQNCPGKVFIFVVL